MKKMILFFALLMPMLSCTTQKTLYTWGKYSNSSYNYLKNSNEEATKELIEAYQKIIAEQKGSRETVPPGIYADYGFILLQADRTEEGKAMLLKEIELYPESQIFIDRILSIIEP